MQTTEVFVLLAKNILESGCLYVCLSMCHTFCLEDIFQTTKLYATKHRMMVHHHNPECHAKRPWVAIFKGKVKVQGQILKKKKKIHISHEFLTNFTTQFGIVGSLVIFSPYYTDFHIEKTSRVFF